MDVKKEDESFAQAMLFTNPHIFPYVFEAAMELRLFDIIARAGDGVYISPSEIASQLPSRNTNAASLVDRMLRLLATHNLLSCSLRTAEDGSTDVERVYALTPTSKFFLRNDDHDGISLASMLIPPTAEGHAFNQLWLNLKHAVLEDGNLFQRDFGMSLYEFMGKDPERNKVFNQMMFARSSMIVKKIVEIYKGFEGLSSLVDVGGGIGACLNIIISKHPSIKGINFDLSQVVQIAPSYPGIENVGGNMFVSIPKADAIMLKDVCHNWGDEDCIKILSNCYEALPKNGKVIVIELVKPEEGDPSLGSQYATQVDNAMMLLTCDGKERTGREYELLCKRSGFSGFQIVCCAYGCLWSVMEFIK